jgi:hypothetical protein
VLGPGAVADLERIHGHYDSVEAGLGRRFVEALDELFVRLEEFPRSAPLVAGYVDVRHAVVRGFPHVVFYRLPPRAGRRAPCPARGPRGRRPAPPGEAVSLAR